MCDQDILAGVAVLGTVSPGLRLLHDDRQDRRRCCQLNEGRSQLNV